MASSRVSTAITWSSSASTTLNTNNVVASDAFTFNVEDWEATMVVSADNAGTPAAGDTVDLWVSWTAGDVLGDSGDDFTTDEHSEFLGRLDTVAANTPGEDPVRAAFHLPTGAKGFKLLARANQGATRNVTLRAMISTHRVQ
jgi:hypothetical protein